MAKKVVKKEGLKLDLGCGTSKTKGFHGVDCRRITGVDTVHDLRLTPWPWDDGSVEEIECNYLLCFLDGLDRCTFMNEAHRILQPKGKMTVRVPHWSNMRAYADPFLKWPPLCEMSFMIFNAKWREDNFCAHYPLTCDFDFGYGHSVIQEVATRNDDYRMHATRHWVNATIDLHVTMTKR